jgi:FAD/FMN-containing dehydrogenase
VPRKIQLSGFKRPDYRFTATTVADVEKAVQFVTKYNLRLTIINTGHDYQGRNDAPSGLSLDVSQLRGVKLDSSFTPTVQCVDLVPGRPVEQTQMIDGKTPAVTFGVGIVGSELNNAVKSNGWFVVTGGARKCRVRPNPSSKC